MRGCDTTFSINSLGLHRKNRANRIVSGASVKSWGERFDFIGKVRFGEPPKPAREPRALPYSLHIRVRTFAAFSDEAVDPRRDNGQWYRAEL